ncbi:MAG: hypothetical protein SH850_14900 [Planctomycetaceae bacterium]|nr:hypothetical protein [Planctomycetaceae bacterium]
MLRAIFSILGIFSVVALLAQATVVGWLWTQGTLNPTSIKEIRLALAGQSASEPTDAQESAQSPQTSQDEIQEARLIRVLELESRENELSLLKRMTSETVNELISDRKTLDELKAQFHAELEQLRQQAENGATEQTRGILLTSPPEEAVQRLMGLTAPEGVGLLRGLPEKSISRILQAFQTNPDAAKRGQELFEGIYHGEPTRSVIRDTLEKLDAGTDPQRPAG